MLDHPKLGKEWMLEKRENALPHWELRGLKEGFEDRDEDDLQSMIRCERRLGTHGFFVAVFVRKTKKAKIKNPLATHINGHIAETSQSTEQKKKVTEKSTKKQRTVRQPPAQIMKEKSASGPDFSLLRLATLDRKRRTRLAAERAARKLISEQHSGSCGCAH